MPWLTSTFLRARRAAAYGAHALCALSLAACAVAPAGDEADMDAASGATSATPSARATPADKTARAGKTRGKTDAARAAAPANAGAVEIPAATGSWNLFGWGDDADKRDESRNPLDGLRADIGTFEERGTASWYGKQFHGRKTANGERFDMGAMTAAHPSLPLDSWVLVRNLRNDKVAVLRINDRGPYHGNRVLDVSYRAAKRLGFVSRGHTQVEIRRLSRTELAALGPLRDPGMDNGATDGGGDGTSAADSANDSASGEARKARRPVKVSKVSAKRVATQRKVR